MFSLAGIWAGLSPTGITRDITHSSLWDDKYIDSYNSRKAPNNKNKICKFILDGWIVLRAKVELFVDQLYKGC